MSDEAKKFGAEGGKKRAANLTKQERSEAARLAAAARWGGDLPVADYNGVLQIGDLQFPCAVLSDGTRVLTQSDFMAGMGMYYSGSVKNWALCAQLRVCGKAALQGAYMTRTPKPCLVTQMVTLKP